MPFYHTSRVFFGFTVMLVAAVIFSFLFTPPAKTVTAEQRGEKAQAAGKPPLSEQIDSITETGKFVYGKSGLGADLTCIKIAPAGQKTNVVLMGFEIHGYEDLFPKDGQVLVEIANSVARYFEQHRGELEGTELYIIPSQNPDGLVNGSTNNGPGRCQITMGIDLNRDFDYYFTPFAESRNHTGEHPASAPETQALVELVHTIKPNMVIDCHGWENTLIGDRSLADCFKSSLGIAKQRGFSSNDHGYFSAWASTQSAKAMLLELPVYAAHDSSGAADKMIAGIKNMAELFK